MIITDFDNVDRYVPVAAGFRKAVDFFRRPDFGAIPDGTVEIAGRNVFAIIQSYETENDASPRFEFHRRYIDIQMVLSGEELIGWIPTDRVTVTEAYDGEKDIAFGTASEGEWTAVRLGPGQLAVFFPEDGHAPRLAAGPPAAVRKVVVKVSVETGRD